jgi:DNA-binding XRE family transcriptional regulator
MRKDNVYKFNIKTRLNNLPAIDRDAAMKAFPQLLKTSRQTISIIMNCRLDSDYQPNVEIMLKFASFFKVDVRDLYNNPPAPIKIKDVHNITSSSTANELNLTA